VEHRAYSLNFSQWCGHCKSIKPTWEKVAGLFGDEPLVQIVSVDADKHASLGEKYSVKGFPTLKFFGPDGKDVPYESGRNLDDIVSFLNEKAGTDVAADGTVTPSGGLLPQVHDVLTGFGSASPEEQHAMLEKAAAVVAEDGKDLDRWSLYSKIGKKIIAEGMECVIPTPCHI
jgi:protein disulfide-isomerase A6